MEPVVIAEPPKGNQQSTPRTKLQTVVARLQEHEMHYLSCLEFVSGPLLETTLPQLMELNGGDSDASVIFGKFSEVFRVEKNLDRALKSCRDEEVGAVFTQQWTELQRVYTDYYGAYAGAATAWDASLRRRDLFSVEAQRLLEGRDAARLIGGLTFEDLLLMPLFQPGVWLRFLDQMAKLQPSMEESARRVREGVATIGKSQELTDDNQRSGAQQIDSALIHKKSVKKIVKREKDWSALKDGRLLLKSFDVRIALPRSPQNVMDGRIHICNDVAILVNTVNYSLIGAPELRSLVVSRRREPHVGESDEARALSFSLFWSRPQGRLEHYVVTAQSHQDKHAIMAKLQLAIQASLNRLPSPKNIEYFLVRERKSGQGRSNEFGAAFHFTLWGFGAKSFYRCDAETGQLMMRYKCTELRRFSKIVTAEGEHRLLVRTAWEKFEIVALPLPRIVAGLRVIMKRKLERPVPSKRRKQRVPWTDDEDINALAPDKLKLLEDYVRAQETAALNARVQERMKSIQQAYSDVSYTLYERETELAELQENLASTHAPTREALARGMTPKESRLYAEGRGPRRREEILDDDSKEASSIDLRSSGERAKGGSKPRVQAAASDEFSSED